MQPMSDSAEILMLSNRFSHIEDAEMRTENIKRRIKLMWNFVKPATVPPKVVVKQLPPEEPKHSHGDLHDQQFSWYKRADVGGDLVEQLKRKWEY